MAVNVKGEQKEMAINYNISHPKDETFAIRYRLIVDTLNYGWSGIGFPPYSDRKIARAIKTVNQSPSKYYYGEATPQFKTLKKISETFCVSADWLMGFTGDDEHIQWLHGINHTVHSKYLFKQAVRKEQEHG